METQGRAPVALPTEREIVITGIFDAPRRLVFEMWTKAEHVAHWWDPICVPLALCAIDVHPGGALRFEHGGADGTRHTFAGGNREIDRPSRLVFTTAAPSGAASTGALALSAAVDATRLTMTIACASRADRDARLAMRVDARSVRRGEAERHHPHASVQRLARARRSTGAGMLGAAAAIRGGADAGDGRRQAS